MNINGVELTTRQRDILRLALNHELTAWKDCVGRAEADIAGEYCREQVRQCQALLTLVTEQAVCDASAGQ